MQRVIQTGLGPIEGVVGISISAGITHLKNITQPFSSLLTTILPSEQKSGAGFSINGQ
ncbi:unnamed protein product, partial [marine sediment metagenome]